jgi:hypothetical protein
VTPPSQAALLTNEAKNKAKTLTKEPREEMKGHSPAYRWSDFVHYERASAAVTPLGVKHAFISQIMSIVISYMFIIACNLNWH